MAILDSGARTEFSSGAVRDIKDDRGRCDLMPLTEVGDVLCDPILSEIGAFIYDGEKIRLARVLRMFPTDDVYTMFLETSIHYKEGLEKYGERNWEKGIPLSSFIDSAVRHYLKFLREDTDERHDRAFVWNILGAMWTLDNKPEMINLPFKEMRETT